MAPDAADEGRFVGPPSTGDEEVGMDDDGVDAPTLQSELRERDCEAPPDGSKFGALRVFVWACSGVAFPVTPAALAYGLELAGGRLRKWPCC